MWVIVTYDVGIKRNPKVLKTCRRYLNHVQKSVFEGNIEKRKLEKLKRELYRLIKPESDQVAIYELDTLRYFSKDIIGYHTEDGNIL